MRKRVSEGAIRDQSDLRETNRIRRLEVINKKARETQAELSREGAKPQTKRKVKHHISIIELFFYSE